ncbi:hypothetical protein ANN_26149 [Periplaneta americana]|uniref:Mos1 transposase HTH domain-containing protein n=1 Tax=Periplaneta americana TaxID=6978 RepID=A0ABQ8S554_PERAM|nr:hypothetical protein ANN_26149 [Periplaneta americana]
MEEEVERIVINIGIVSSDEECDEDEMDYDRPGSSTDTADEGSSTDSADKIETSASAYSYFWNKVNRPLSMKKEGIQTRKRKPKNPGQGGQGSPAGSVGSLAGVIKTEMKPNIQHAVTVYTVHHHQGLLDHGVILISLPVVGFSRKMTERIEQRYCIKFCQKLGDSQSQTIRKIQQVFGEDAMGVTQIKEWFNRFKDGRTSAESEQRCGRPQTARSAAVVERVRNLVMADRRLTVREIAEEVGVSKDSAHAILRDDLNMNRVAAKFLPKLLSPEQKDLRRDVAQDLLDTANTDPGFLNTVITGDESWVYGYDPGTKDSRRNGSIPSLQGRRKRGRCEAKSSSAQKTRHVDGEQLALASRQRPAHSSQLIHTFLAKHGITTVHQPPYSPDLAPCDFWLFPKLKTPLKGSHFESREEIMRNATTELNTIPKEDFQRCFRQWKDRWAKCVQAQGAYFEGD